MRILLALTIWLVSASAFAATLDVHFTDLKAHNGHLLVRVYAHADHYRANTKTLRHKRIAMTKLGTTVDVEFNLPPGRYVVDAMQDVNDDGKLNANFMHIPSEPTGCSRNPRPWRRPHFDECVFKLPVAGRSIEIDMH